MKTNKNNSSMKSLNEIFDMCPSFYERESFANGYLKGYEQAEEDRALTWEDMRELHIIFTEVDVDIELGKTDIKTETLGYYEEVLKRFKNLKK